MSEHLHRLLHDSAPAGLLLDQRGGAGLRFGEASAKSSRFMNGVAV